MNAKKPPRPRAMKLLWTEEEFRALDDKRHAERTTWQELGERFFTEWLTEKNASKTDRTTSEVDYTVRHATRPEHERWHKMLQEILDGGVKEYIDAIVFNLIGWSKASGGIAASESFRSTEDNLTPSQARALRDADIALERAQKDREGAAHVEKRVTKRHA